MSVVLGLPFDLVFLDLSSFDRGSDLASYMDSAGSILPSIKEYSATRFKARNPIPTTSMQLW